MILFLHGPDSFRLQQRLQILKQGFIKKYDKAGFNVDSLDGNDLTTENFRKACLSDGLFSKKRLIIIRNVFSANKDLSEQIDNEVDKIDKDNVAIFTSLELPRDKTNKLLKKLLQADKVEEFGLLKPGQVYHWIQAEIKKQKATIDNNAVNYLVEAVGDDLWRLQNEIGKLTSYVKHITMKEVNLFINSPIDDNIFNFTDALSNKDGRRALKLLHDQLESGANEFYLLTMLARQIKILLQVKETNGKGLDLHPFVIKKAMPQSNKFALDDLKKLFQKLTNIDAKLKASQGNARLWLDLFVVDMCS